MPWAATWRPAVLPGRAVDRVAFISYFKGEYRLQTIETGEPMKEVDQEVKTASADETIDFQPDITHEVVPENKRKKRTFEKLFLEGRPPLNIGVTSGGDFFGGSQIALTDVLGDHNVTATAISVQEFRSYSATYFNLSRRLHYGLSAFDYTQFFYPSPYELQTSFFREGALATQRYMGATVLGQYPLDKFHRVEFLGRNRAANRGLRERGRRAARAPGGGAAGPALRPELGSDRAHHDRPHRRDHALP
jgi:hypothetical protein